jgi:hypothetical protein
LFRSRFQQQQLWARVYFCAGVETVDEETIKRIHREAADILGPRVATATEAALDQKTLQAASVVTVRLSVASKPPQRRLLRLRKSPHHSVQTAMVSSRTFAILHGGASRLDRMSIDIIECR